MPLLDTNDPRPVHFVGIAGAGMSALAELFVRRGTAVTGCDAHPENAADLERLGVRVTPHDPSHVDGARALVITSAMPREHPELVRARELGVPVIRRAEALGEVTAGRELVAIAGTHGKTTTTTMTTLALAAAGRDPTAVVGGRVTEWNGNLRLGGDRLYVVEADEYDRSFLALTPTVAVVTNVEADHLDIYADLADIRETFAKFLRGARAVVLCGDDAGASTLATPNSAEVIRYGERTADARLVAHDVHATSSGMLFSVVYDDERLGGVALGVPGRHNMLNALAAIASGLAIGAPFDGLAAGLAEFRGVERRFQRVGEVGGVSVIDDYAHHPTEIAATIAAARGAYPGRRLVVAFQPHLFSRTRDFSDAFGASLAAADAVFLCDIYPARETPIPGVTSALVETAVTSHGGTIAWTGSRPDVAPALASAVRAGDVVITIGAGDITRAATDLVAGLSSRS